MSEEKTWGGKRAGSGRKRKREKFSAEVAIAEKKLAAALSGKDKLPSIVDALLDLARGVRVEEVDDETGEATVYKRPPDLKAVIYIHDRIMGKPTERQEVDLQAEIDTAQVTPIDIRSAIAPLAPGPMGDSELAGEG